MYLLRAIAASRMSEIFSCNGGIWLLPAQNDSSGSCPADIVAGNRLAACSKVVTMRKAGVLIMLMILSACRPLSKTVRFNVLRVVPAGSLQKKAFATF